MASLDGNQQGSLLLRGGKPVCLDGMWKDPFIDVGVDQDGRVSFAGRWDGRQPYDQVLDLKGAYLSPAWIDMHVHCYYGATWLSVRPEDAGPQRGVGLVVDCGSAGEANFSGLRDLIIAPAGFPILAFLNISSIGLVAANRISELLSPAMIDPVGTAYCIAAHPEIIKGIKVRAAGPVVGALGIAPVQTAREVARAMHVPLVVHIGEAPPTLDEILDLLQPGDVITHCFTGKLTVSVGRHDRYLYRLRDLSAAGLIVDVGHGQGSFHYPTARRAVEAGLLPTTISTDLHVGNLHGPVWDLATTMTKMITVGMALEDVIERVTLRPARFLNREDWGSLRAGIPAHFTVFEVADGAEELEDSYGNSEVARRIVEPRYLIDGARALPASRTIDRGRTSTSISPGMAEDAGPPPLQP